MIAYTAKSLYTPLERVDKPLLLVEDGAIAEIWSLHSKPAPQSARLIDFGDAVLTPGFLDVHIHGGGGHDVMEPDAAALPIIQKLLAKHGVTSYLPTTVTASIDHTCKALDRLATAIEQAEQQEDRNGTQPLGVHLEGPFISHVRPGVHPPEDLRKPTLEAFEKLWQAARGHIRVMTIAPELDGALEVIAEAEKRGVCVSMGHSDATISAARAGVKAGVRHVTHVFNAMRPLDHREPGILGEALTNNHLTTEVIADGIHLDPVAVKLVLQNKGLDGTVFITDATAGTDMPDGRYHLGTFEFEVKEGRCLANGKLAGSVLTMDQAVRNAMQFANLNLQQALRPATLNPAKVGGVDRGMLKAGAKADFLVMSDSGEVRKTYIAGKEMQSA